MIGTSTQRVLDTPGLVNCGIGGRLRKAARAVAVTAHRVAWHRWVGGVVVSIVTNAGVIEIVAHWPK